MKTPAKAAKVNTEPSVVTNGSADGNPKQRIPCVPVELPDTWDCSSSDLDIQFGDFPPRPVEVPKESEYPSKPLARVASTSPKFGQISRKEWRGELYLWKFRTSFHVVMHSFKYDHSAVKRTIWSSWWRWSRQQESSEFEAIIAQQTWSPLRSQRRGWRENYL